MFMSPKFKALASQSGDLVIGRNGVASAFVIPEALKKRTGYDANVVNKQIVFSEGESIYILADELGFIGGTDTEVEGNIFFVEGGVVLELVSGKVLIKGENDEVYSIDEMGDIDYPRSNARIHWESFKDIHAVATTVMTHRYSVSPDAASNYVDNLVINTKFHYGNSTNGYVFKRHYVEQFEDLGLGIFQFVNYANNEFADDDDDHADLTDLVDVEDEEEEQDKFDMEKDEFEDSF